MAGAALATRLEPSESIDDYRIIRPLGRGGRTFLAHDRFLDRAIVLSMLPASPEARAESLAVARAFANASDPSLVRVHRVREGGDRPYVVAAFERGRRLEEEPLPLPPSRVLELGRQLARALAELHAAGASHGDVRAGRVIVSDDGVPCLVGLERARSAATDVAKRADVEALVALLGSLADPDLRGHVMALAGADLGVSTAHELRYALETLGRPESGQYSLQDSPYRGLRAFDREHASTFYGREREVAELLERLRDRPWLLVAGRSGAGKSSLVRAGLAPAVASGALGERGSWDVISVSPGTNPLDALTKAIAPAGAEESWPARDGRRGALLAARLRVRSGRGLLLVIDQLEEVMTLASERARDEFCAALESFGTLVPGLRVVFTLRGDFLDRLVELRRFGRDLVRNAYLLPPMTPRGLREAVSSPARARGFEFETPAMVDALVEEVSHLDEALPLLSFALAELWEARDGARRIIPEAALHRLGGAVAGLARHGDLVLATLSETERAEAKRILLLLVGDGAGQGRSSAASSGTIALEPARSDRRGRTEARTKRVAADLVGAGGPHARAALEALVRGRLIIAGDTYEIAHETLARVWPRLRAWLDEASEARAAAGRLAVATREWVRLGRGAEGLGGERLLRDVEIPGALEGASADARAFVAASRAHVRRARERRLALVAGIPILVAILGVGAWGVSQAKRRGAVAHALAAARDLDAKAAQRAREAEGARAQAMALFDKNDLGPAEDAWTRMLALEDDVDRQRRGVGASLDEALALDPQEPGARALYADVYLARLLAAERLHKDGLLRELRPRLAAYDDGSRAALLASPAHVVATSDPPGATLTLWRYREDAAGALVESDRRALAAGARIELDPGSYLVVAESSGKPATRSPFLVRRGEDRALRVVLPRGAIPEGMVYVPPGRFLYGSTDDEDTRTSFLNAQPARDVESAAYLIARTEVTNRDYLAFLGALPDAEMRARMPRGLTVLNDGRVAWKLRDKVLGPGEPYCSGAQPCVDWSALPVDGVSREDGESYAAWLSRSGRLAGARLCTDREWERAGRGADARRYTNGNDEPGPAEACSLLTYGRDAQKAGPCAVGTHPATRSPFGVEDLVGSQWEWVAGPYDVALPEQGHERGGGWANEGQFLVLTLRAAPEDPKGRNLSDGLRICADAR